MKRRITAGLAGLAMLGIVAAGCGTGTAVSKTGQNSPSTGSGQTPLHAVTTAAGKTAGIQSGAVDAKITVSGIPKSATGSGPSTASVNALVDFSLPAGEFMVQLGLPKAGTIKVILDTRTGLVYINAGNKLSQLLGTTLSGTAGKNWLEIDLKALGHSSGTYLAALAKLGDPAKLIGQIAPYIGSVVSDGPATVGQTATTKYTLSVELSKIVAQLISKIPSVTGSSSAPGASAMLGPMLQAITGSLPKNLPVQVWVGASGYVRELSTRLPLASLFESLASGLRSAFGSSASTSASAGSSVPKNLALGIDIVLSRVNRPITFGLPNPADVSNVTSQVSKMMASGGSSPLGAISGLGALGL